MSVKDIEDKIASERTAIAKAQSRNAELTHSRTVALEAGDDGQVDCIETDIRINEVAVIRGRDRIVILERRLEEAKQADRESQLDALAAQTDQLRIDGETLMGQYREHAAAIAPMMLKLKQIDERMRTANSELKAAGRNAINGPNAIRCRPSSSAERVVRRRLGIGQSEHPLHSVARFDANGNCRHRETGEPIEQFGEFDVVERTFDPGFNSDPLYVAVQLPRIATSDADFWPNPNATAEVVAQQPTILGKVRNLIGSKAA